MRERLNKIDLNEGLVGIVEGAIGAGFLIADGIRRFDKNSS